MRITWLGHGGFIVEDNKTVCFDPWLTGNPKAPFESIDKVPRTDIVCITHDHGDHGFDDGVQIAKRDNATVVGIHEVSLLAQEAGVQNVAGGNLGGTLEANEVKITLVKAFHSSDKGTPSGFVVNLTRAIYHSGDTDVFGDMALIGELYKPEIAFLPIGSWFTMGPKEAAKAVELLRTVKTVIPMHWGTFPILEPSPDKFVELVGDRAKVVPLEPGKSVEI